MLKITVALVPGGIGAERVLGEMLIKNIGGGEFANYECGVDVDDLTGKRVSSIKAYPRWSATVWDLVARALCHCLYGAERLGRRPTPVRKFVPIYDDGNLCSVPFVRMADIPEPARSKFERSMQYSTVPVIETMGACAYAHDWRDFLGGHR